MEKTVESKPTESKHHEEQKEEAEWHQKGSNSTSSWHRVMKVTKETSSKTEECTKTYKVVGGKKRLVESVESSNAKVNDGNDDRLAESEEKEKTEEGDKIKSIEECHDDTKEDGKAEEIVVEREAKKPIACACCSKCNIM